MSKKYDISGFNQQRLIDYGLNITDAFLLRWFVDNYPLDTMHYIIEGNQKYYHLNISHIMESLPIVSFESTHEITYRFNKMMESGILYRKRQGHTDYFRLYISLKVLTGDDE